MDFCFNALPAVAHHGERIGSAALVSDEQTTAAQALEVGFPTLAEVVPGGNDECVARAVAVCAERIAAGGGRRFDTTEASRLRRINAEESANLANAFVSTDFMSAMYDFNTKRQKAQLANFWWAAKATLPLWKPAAVVANATR